jgi:glycosyltransferase involved in cell wall biosynthesis
MRIAVIGPLDVPGTQGGMTRHCLEIYTRLAAAGHDVTFIVANNDGLAAYRGITLRRVPAVKLPGWRRLGYSLIASVLAASGAYDIVHYHSFSSTGFCFLPSLRKRAVVVTIHRLEWQDEKWGLVARSFLRFSEWIAMHRARALISVSRNFAEDLRRRYPHAVPITYIANGVDPATPTDPNEVAAFGLTPGTYLLFVGRLVPEKGIDLLADTVAKLRADGVDVGQVAIVGGGIAGSEYVGALAARAESEHLDLLGLRTGEELAALYGHARVFVAPSFHEGQPLTVLEAMSYGLPIVASDIAAHRELLDGEALLFRSGDPDDFAAALARVLGSPELAGALGAAGRSRIESGEFDWNDVASATKAVLETVMAVASTPSD